MLITKLEKFEFFSKKVKKAGFSAKNEDFSMKKWPEGLLPFRPFTG